MTYEVICDNCGKEIPEGCRHVERVDGKCFCNDECDAEYKEEMETTTIKLSIFNGDNWETIYTKEIPNNVGLEEINLEVENKEYVVWGTPLDFVEKERD